MESILNIQEGKRRIIIGYLKSIGESLFPFVTQFDRILFIGDSKITAGWNEYDKGSYCCK